MQESTAQRSPLSAQARRLLAAAAAIVLAGLVLSCGGAGGMAGATNAPRWACPSPTPKPFGRAGPVKEVLRHTRPITEGGDYEETIYYELWEQEYGDLGGPPFPSPTPYGMIGTSYALGQRVEIWPAHLLVTAAGGPVVDVAGASEGSRQLHVITLEWVNHTDRDLPVDYGAQLLVEGIRDPSGRVQAGEGWRVTAEALHSAGVGGLPATIPPGESSVRVPVIGVRGEVETVSFTFIADPHGARLMPTAAQATPTPNAHLRAAGPSLLTVYWSNTVPQLANAPLCASAGALTDWDTSAAWGAPANAGLEAPPGAGRLVQIALGQVGKRYVWGAKGPETFDCSGLASWSYVQIGIAIPQGTANQWPRMRAADRSQLRPGDLIFFSLSAGRVDHVGILAGDLNGDGTWDMVHAANPALGVRVDYSVFESRYYGPRIVGFRTAR